MARCATALLPRSVGLRATSNGIFSAIIFLPMQRLSIFAGFFFDGPEAGSWLGQGLSIYEREISRQILPDGGHFELSPMYHAIILEDLLDVINAARTFGYGRIA